MKTAGGQINFRDNLLLPARGVFARLSCLSLVHCGIPFNALNRGTVERAKAYRERIA